MKNFYDLNLTVREFKSKYPRIYKQIIDYYGKDNVYDKEAALVLYFKNRLIPRCEICQKQLKITKKFRKDSTTFRCANHINSIIVEPEIIIKANKYNYEILNPLEDLTLSTKLTLKCPDHGIFSQTVGYFLNGGRCQQCYHESRTYVIDKDEWVKRCVDNHNEKYDYTNVNFTGISNSVELECPEHGSFIQNAGVHMRGHGCPKCGINKKPHYTTDEFIKKAQNKHGLKYDYSQTIYRGSRNKVTIKCKKHGIFEQLAYYHLSGHGCPKCGIEMTTNKSAAEFEIIDFLKSINIKNIEHSWRGLGTELDIYLPDYNLAIEYNGLYWHSSGNLVNDKQKRIQHISKTELCENNGIQLLHIMDFEWLDPLKKEIWKSVIQNKLKLTPNRIYARKCRIVPVSSILATKFMDENHLQGSISGKVNIGLAHNGTLVALGIFAKARYRKNHSNVYELLRFASKKNYSIPGAFRKVLSEFKRRVSEDTLLISYANRRWSNGNVYEKNNFKFVGNSGPCYYYTDLKQVWHRSKFQKHKLKDQLSVYDPNLTEVENMYNNKYRRFWDCGNKVYEVKMNEF